MNTIPFKINKNIIQKIGGYSIASSENNYTKFDFQFSDDWNKIGIQVSATMFFDSDKIPDPVLLTMRNDNTGYCYLPSTLKDEHGTLKLGLTGVYADDKNERIVINTLLTSMPIGQGAFMTKYPANDIYKDMLARIASFDKSKQDRLICKNGITIDKDSNISVDDDYVITTGNIPKYVDPIKKEIEQLEKNKLNGMTIRCTDLSELLNYEPGIYLALLNCAGFYESSQLEECEVLIDEYGITIYIVQAGLFYFITKEQISNGKMPEKLNLNINEIDACLAKKADKIDVDNSIDEIKADLDTKENASNKKNAIDGSSAFYPSNIAVKNYVAKELIEPKSEIAQLKLSKADLVQSHNMFDWDKLLTTKSNIFTVSKIEDEGYHITGRTANRYSQILSNQELSLEDGDYYLCDNVTNNATVSVCCQLILIDTDGYRTYYNNTKVTIDKSKYTSIFLSVQTDASVGEVDSVIYPILCKYENINIPYLPNKVADGVPLIARHIADTKNYTDHNLDTKENISNKIDTINFPSTTYYPSTKAVFDYVNSKLETPLSDIESLKSDKLDKTDFNSYKTSNDNAVNSKVDTTDFNAYKISTDKVIADNTNSIKANTTAIDKCVTDIANNSALISKNQINVTTDKSTSIVLNDSSDCNIVGLTLYGKSTQSAIPTPTNPVAIKNINNPKITVTNDSDSQSINIQCTLRGIGNVCDTLTVKSDGTGYITQRLFAERITSQRKSTSLEWNYSKATHRFFRNDYSYSFDVKDNKPLILCSHLDVGENEKNTAFDNSIGWINVSGVGIAIRMTEFDGDIAKFKKWLDDNEVYVVAPRSKPITVNLSKDEVDKILSLHTYYPSTKISADTDFEVTYIADTKNYIDSKFNELATAIVAHESEVM